MQYHISHVPDSIGERWWRMLMDETINELPYDITLPHRTLVSLTTSLFELTIYRSWTNFSWIATESGGLHQWPVPAVYTKNSACPFTVSLLRCTPFEDVFFILLFKYLSWRSGRDNLIIILILGYALSFYLLLKYNIPFSWHWFGATCWLLAGWLVGFLLSFFQLFSIRAHALLVCVLNVLWNCGPKLLFDVVSSTRIHPLQIFLSKVLDSSTFDVGLCDYSFRPIKEK